METGILTTLGVALLEMVLAGTWVGFYYRNGLPLFWRSASFPSDAVPSGLVDSLSQEHSRYLTHSLCFRSVAPGEIAFRERLFQLTLMSYTPVMRGHIKIDDRTGTLTVTGRAYAWPFAFAAVWMFGWYNRPVQSWPAASMPALFFLFLLGVLYVIQAVRFNRVFHSVRQKLHTASAS